ncbi:hypothetical protein ABOM_006658 [Aspergillus bombycis]|uniref:Rhodopsin domain-containing protein n=1 Tax=Aspergillus bombycis TaxID=109264 RepID=A0A1F8A080_9EURO|nr:hypothetical protein ABOM_006658 [Aspergillus bombycis]OGM45087.1 hypothetical protein ABOM_006658 [Aspergillus bombycis]
MAIGGPRGRYALSVSATFTCLATCATALRIYTRAFMVKQMGIDDWAILSSLACSWVFFGLFVGGLFPTSSFKSSNFVHIAEHLRPEVTYLMGEHIENIPPEVFVKQMMCFWVTVPMYQASLIITKAAILFQYLRIFVTPRMRLACYGLVAFLAIYGAWAFFTGWLVCVPVKKLWDDSVHGFCFNKKALWLSNSAIHIFTDILILLYPMPIVRSLQLPRPQKIALTAVFAVGVLVTVTSILRLQSLLIISQSTDPTYDNPPAAMWSAIECNVAIICACLPVMRPLISRLIPRIFSTRSNGSRSKPTNGYLNSIQRTQRAQPRTSVVGGTSDHYMVDLGTRGKSSTAESPERAELGEIMVTTVFSHESGRARPDDESSVRHLVAD